MRQKIIVALCAASLLMLVGAQAASAANGVKVGKVSGVKGTVSVVHEGGTKPVSLAVRDAVYVNDKITTGERSRVKLLMDDDSILTLGQKGELVVREYDYRPSENRRSSVIKLVTGNLRSLISKFFSGAGSKFEVHTPTAVAGARGTNNINAVLSPDRTLSIGLSGTTSVTNIDTGVPGGVDLTGNHGSYVDTGQPPSAPFLVTDDILGPLNDDTQLPGSPRFNPDDVGGPELPGGGVAPDPFTEIPSIPPVEQVPADIPHENVPVEIPSPPPVEPPHVEPPVVNPPTYNGGY